jgi:bifunctional ADP-heptose synthase (sugar kinase/adenylyltransferase)
MANIEKVIEILSKRLEKELVILEHSEASKEKLLYQLRRDILVKSLDYNNKDVLVNYIFNNEINKLSVIFL